MQNSFDPTPIWKYFSLLCGGYGSRCSIVASGEWTEDMLLLAHHLSDATLGSQGKATVACRLQQTDWLQQ